MKKHSMKSTDESSTTLLDICIACAEICYANAATCKEMEGMEDCYHVCINCAEACEKVISELSGNSEFLVNAVDQCAHICGVCAKECAKYDNIHCRECSEICRKCAEICASILGQEKISESKFTEQKE